MCVSAQVRAARGAGVVLGYRPYSCFLVVDGFLKGRGGFEFVVKGVDGDDIG